MIEARHIEKPSLLVVLALLTVYVVWGSTYLAIRFALEGGFPPLLMSGLRFGAAGLLLYAVLRWRGVPNPTPRQWAHTSVIGVLMLVMGTGMVVVAEQWVPSGLAAVGVATVPLWAALFAALFGQAPRRAELLGLGVGFAGTLALGLEGDLRASPLGAGLLLLAAVCWALGSIWSRRLDLPGGLMTSAVEMLAGGAVLSVAGLLLGERFHAAPTVGGWTAFLYLMTFGSLIAFSAYAFLLANVRPALATSYAYVNPGVAVLLGALLANERIGLAGMAALLLILGGVALMARAPKPSPAPSAD
ncbi:drug/metabolite transporter (DMT)-like permease [Deinobacterium chartae]|uniref:Drug/metabolite transporter (DMT)-like permease n=1 Tax=Deinobacterium chartae TaxID=521158 RepID=A0A841HX36_9DEIO|nr:drug/metabolite exporter YedA [Deinobacterium chartae]MBB6097486.1 drug/metabolite transporter (DMT)-like permease [Deinobacterium chartae]